MRAQVEMREKSMQVLAAAILLFASPALAEAPAQHRIAQVENAQTWLNGLRTTVGDRRQIDEWIQQLGHADFYAREAATNKLLECDPLPIVELNEATRSSDLEMRWRAKQILSRQTSLDKIASERESARAMLKLIREERVPNFTFALLEVTPRLHALGLGFETEETVARVAVAEEAERLRRCMHSGPSVARAAAARAVARVVGAAAAVEFRKLTQDGNDIVVLAAAHSLAEIKDRAALPVLVKLTSSEVQSIRVRSVRLLRTLTRQEFGLNAFQIPEEQVSQRGQWESWLRTHAATLQFPVSLDLKPLREELAVGMLAHFTFDEDQGLKVPNSVKPNDPGTIHNGTHYIPRGDGRALVIEGTGHHGSTGGYVQLPAVPFQQYRQFTVALWVREDNMSHQEGEAYINFGTDDAAGNSAVGIAHFNNEMIFRSGGGKIHVPYLREDRGRWVHYAMTFQSGILTAYRNGNLVGTTRATVSVNGDRSALGRHWWAGGQGTSTRFQGAIDDVRIYKRSLTHAQIRTLVEATAAAAAQ